MRALLFRGVILRRVRRTNANVSNLRLEISQIILLRLRMISARARSRPTVRPTAKRRGNERVAADEANWPIAQRTRPKHGARARDATPARSEAGNGDHKWNKDEEMRATRWEVELPANDPNIRSFG